MIQSLKVQVLQVRAVIQITDQGQEECTSVSVTAVMIDTDWMFCTAMSLIFRPERQPHQANAKQRTHPQAERNDLSELEPPRCPYYNSSHKYAGAKMKRLFGLKKKKIKIGGDEDEEQTNDITTNSHHNKSYSPPSVGGTTNSGSSSAYDFQQVNEKFPNVDIINSNNPSSAPSADLPTHQRNNDNNEPIPIGAGYRYALTAYNDTINPALSNEDGM
eukprot:scaffold28871_cov117-Skeletonema_dohrnii-CCMP3373.AAC.1